MSATASMLPARAHGEEVESFYRPDGSTPPGTTCDGTACFVARHLGAKSSADADTTKPRLYCLGRCYAAPATKETSTRPPVHLGARQGILLHRIVAGGARSLAAYEKSGGYRALDSALRAPREQIIVALEQSGLRGRGGAGFPTGRKWRTVASQTAAEKFVVANADEGDPGAFSDRLLLEDDPHSVIEGMLLAGYAVGASAGWIHVRTEYPEAAQILREAIREARRANLIGCSVLGRDFAFELEVRVGRGRYVCGEETALLRSLEGRRPEVMARPPYPSEHGLFGQPTLVNNVETLATVPWIVGHGGPAYHALGFSRSRGTKLLSLNSLFARPGLHEVEFGTTLRHIVENLGGGLRDHGALQGLIVGGPLAGIVPPALLDVPLGYEELRAIGASVGHGGMIAFDEHTSMAELVHHVFSFAAYESCGQCTPCRLGAREVEEIFARIRETGTASAADLAVFEQVAAALRSASLCGLGTGLGEFAVSALQHFRKELAPCFA